MTEHTVHYNTMLSVEIPMWESSFKIYCQEKIASLKEFLCFLLSDKESLGNISHFPFASDARKLKAKSDA